MAKFVEEEMNVLSLFDGIGCARVALEKAEISVSKYWASEIEPSAIRVAQRNWKDIIEVGSVIGLLESGWIDEPIDLLIGGSPCQDLSIAKKGREGLAGKRSGLFYEYVRIKNELKPTWFILENVASMDNDSRDEISRIMGVEPIMINASLVSAQNRKRYFWTNIPNVVLPDDRNILLKDILESDVDRKYFIETPNIKRHNGKSMQWDTSGKGYLSQQDRAYTVDGKLPTVPHNRAMNKVNVFSAASRGRNLVDGKRHDVVGSKTEQRIEIGGEKENTITKVYKDSMIAVGTSLQVVGRKANEDGIYERDYEERDDGKANAVTKIQSRNLVTIKEKTNTIRKGGRRSGIGDKHNWDTYQINNYVRRLTPVEVERCFGVPDNYTACLPESQRYDCLGNAFNADVVSHILSFIP